MPLTPSHTAAAWPLHRVLPSLPLDALVIGTMAPDFEYLLRLAPRGFYAHTLVGVLTFCLPVGFIVWIAYRKLVRPALITLAPPAIGSALSAPFAAALIAPALLAIFLGALTHITWDAFTHGQGWVVMRVIELRREVRPMHYSGLRWYELLQHVSTALGLAAICYCLQRWVRSRPHADRVFAPGQQRRLMRTIAVFFLITSCAALLNGARAYGRGAAIVLGYAAVGWMDGLVLALVVFGLLTAPGMTPAPASGRPHRT